MGSPEGGGQHATASRCAVGPGARPDNWDGHVSRHRISRYLAGATIATLTIAAAGYGALQLAMHHLGPPPINVAGTSASPAAADHAHRPAVATTLDPDAVDPRYLAMLFAFEDRRFYSHFGVDPIGIVRAARDLVVNGRIVTGGSTLTMQVARLIDNQYDRSPAVKLHQIVRAMQLERSLTKRQILGLYLALAPFGGRTKGVRAASHKYFGKDPRQLSLAEAALLVALPQAPEARRLDRNANAARRARNFVLDTVAAAGVLTPAEAELAKLEPLTSESSTMPPNPVPKPPVIQTASLFAGLTLGMNIVAGSAAAAPMEPPRPHFLGSNEQVVLDVRRNLLRPQPQGTHQDDRDALWMFYAARTEPVWVSKTGWTHGARSLIEEIKRADDWGLSAADFDIPSLPDAADDALITEQQRADAETGLSLVALKYARYARGGRIADPATQLSSYLDRKPQVRPPFLVMTELANADAPDDLLRKLHPQHEQFARLREEYLARRDTGSHTAVDIPSSGTKLKPGASHPDIALVRERLRVPAAGADSTLYDDRLAEVVKRFQAKRGIEPANGVINAKTRRALNEGQKVALSTLLANMEQWRWMPDDLGEAYVWVNVPEFTVRVMKDGKEQLSERVITGEVDMQTPIFSEDLKTIYFHPRWIVPDSIKIKEIGPGLARGRRRDMVVMRNGKVIKPSTVNWYKADIRTYDIYQPSGPGNALGQMKFTFPNKHMVYLHDTQSKGLFDSTQRTFSHGCVRVRNPQRLAELLLGIDKGWTPDEVAKLIKVKGEPEENAVVLDKHIPVHITYFTARVDDDGDITTAKDVYGHEKRITQAIEGNWEDIDKGSDHLAQVELAKRLDDADNAKRRKTARRSAGGRRYATRSYGGGGGFGGSSPTRISSSGSSANDIFRRSFGN